MAVKPHELDNREQQALDPPVRGVTVDRLSVLEGMEERLQRVKAGTLSPKDLRPHCGDCFRRGVQAGVRAIEGQE